MIVAEFQRGAQLSETVNVDVFVAEERVVVFDEKCFFCAKVEKASDWDVDYGVGS